MIQINPQSFVLLHGFFDQSEFDLLVAHQAHNCAVLEGRPTLHSSQQTCAALLKLGIQPVVIADNTAGYLFYKKLVTEVWLSYQTADENKALCPIGSLILAVLGKKHGVPVKAFPGTTKTKLISQGEDLLSFAGVPVVTQKVKTYVPLVEWVEKKYLAVIQPEIAIV